MSEEVVMQPAETNNMLKAGIFLDMENLRKNGGGSMDLRRVKELVVAQYAIVLRARIYMAVDSHKEERDEDFRTKGESSRETMRRAGYNLTLKKVLLFAQRGGRLLRKANADIELAVDALVQSEHLDYVLLGTGDGDFTHLVRTLQQRGKRVDVLSFMQTSTELIQAADHHFHGILVPGILRSRYSPLVEGHMRGILNSVNGDYGFLTAYNGLSADSMVDDIFIHASDISGISSAADLESLRKRGAIIDFKVEDRRGEKAAINAIEINPEMI